VEIMSQGTTLVVPKTATKSTVGFSPCIGLALKSVTTSPFFRSLFRRAKMPHFDRGFSPCGLWLIEIRPSFSFFPQPP